MPLDSSNNSKRQATCSVVIPCLNEEVALPYVIRDFQKFLPDADIWVYDNGSEDNTVKVAKELGANVRSVPLKGKGYAVVQAFADINTDYLFIIDGDATYEAEAAPRLLDVAKARGLDMVTGVRKAENEKNAYRVGHVLGNKLLTGLVKKFFPGQSPSDMLSGYRVFSRRYYKSFAYIVAGFEVETYLTVHALNLAMPTGEVDTVYKERPVGSESKLRTYQDGGRVLSAIGRLIIRERPFFVCGWLGFFLGGIGIALGCSLVSEYIRTGSAPRMFPAILSISMLAISFMACICGILLHYIVAVRKGNARMKYLG